MTEVLFYQLQGLTLDRVLPDLLERTLDRGWRAVVRAGGAERVAALNTQLWTYRDDSFLPHGTAEEGSADRQPVFLTETTDNPNAANVLFVVDGAPSEGMTGYDRCVMIFDGRDETATATAREEWRQAKAAGHDVTFWQQSDTGKWERKA